ncbi:hypothetical protein SAMN00808754_3017 [Thermanaeromonas toyohensis ToBE]|uniref:DUF5320 domain-containing protein n=1 Tax=Thermanaeromonas toyohensis ToBE TaxID=698762 RepID=A0A1W1W225_9FIRM|nr:DUF5320 domain-containing protein [Thermanaeromonas toyohensis]SMB99658.1 hypothetical protein SAMN00808754_3017 [Thermanaeromonas toyohensis ToBE]
MFWGGFPWCLGGFGRGWRYMYYATGLPGWMRAWWGPIPLTGGVPAFQEMEPQVEWLKQQARLLENQLKAIKAQIDALEKEGEDGEEKKN